MRHIAVGLLSAGAVTLLGVQANAALGGHTPSHASDAAIAGGMAQSVVQRGSRSTIFLRASQGRLLTIQLGPGRQVVTADGRLLSAKNVRPGDRMGVLRSGSVEDLSQRVRDLQGIVVMPPESSGNTMILSIQPSGNIVVDTSSQTTFHDPSGKTSSLDEITDADIVDVHGVLDGALGEMTLTDSVTRLGP